MKQSLAGFFTLAFLLADLLVAQDAPQSPIGLNLRQDDHICLIGNTFPDRMQHFGWLESMIHLRYPEHRLVFRNLGFSGDEVDVRHRSEAFGTPDEWLTQEAADVVFAFFGFNESFRGEAGLPDFKQDLEAFLDHTLAANYSGKGSPVVVLFSPIAQEKHPDPNLPDPAANNRNIQLYADAMAEVARSRGVPFADLYRPSMQLYAESEAPLTFNGIHLKEEGYRQIAAVIFKTLFADEPALQHPGFGNLRAAVNDKNWEFFQRYRTIDGYNVFGGRSHLKFDGVMNRDTLLREMEMRDVMTANRDKRVWAIAQGSDLDVRDDNLPPPIEVKTNKPGPNPDGSHPYLGGEEAIARMKVPPGCKVTLFASEAEFPELANPVQMAFDTKGRLWVAVWPNYPEREPLGEKGDSLLIFEDTDGDGKADKCIHFLDDLNGPTGFAFYDDGVLLMQAPDLWLVKDTDGDDRADWMERVLHGIDSADSHHTTNAMCLDPGGATYLSDGVFHRTQVETHDGVVRTSDGCIFRYEPRTQKFETYAPYGFANPHGRVFDYWGNDIITDATGNANYFGPAISGKLDQGKHRGIKQFWNRPSRPCPGTGILTSRHFPEEYQNNFLNINVISFQGIYRVKVTEEGSGLVGETIPEHLVSSDDPNFRPICVDVGPDGAVWFCDWHQTIIGHMQHHIRDPNRDHQHGRIYRITYEGRPLLEPAQIDGAPISHLLDLLKEPENNTRTRAKLELGKRDPAEVTRAVQRWIAGLDEGDPDHAHHMTEALWLHQWLNVVDLDLLRRMLESPDHRARAAATRVLCYWRDRVPDALPLVRARATDDHPRVRLEAIRACSFFRDSAAADAALLALNHPTDYYIDYVMGETIRQLEPWWRGAIRDGNPVAAGNPAGVNYLMRSVTLEELLKLPRTPLVFRELLLRPGVPQLNRLEALNGLAAENGTDPAAELVAVLEDPALDDDAVARDLGRILTLLSSDSLEPLRARLDALRTETASGAIRQAATAAVAIADDSFDALWPEARRSSGTLIDLLNAIPQITDQDLRAAAHEPVMALFDSLPETIAAEVAATRKAVGRHVRIELPRRGTLTLAEVQVFSGVNNVAPRGKASQSSTAHGGEAERAIDGNTSGTYSDGHQTHTRENERNPWFELDLGRDTPIDSVVIWNRSENNGAFAKRLDGFTLTVLDESRREIFKSSDQPAPVTSVSIALAGDLQGAIRRAAIGAIARTGQEPEKVFALLGRLIQEGDQRVSAATAIRQIPRAAYDSAIAGRTAQSILEWAKTVPAADRTGQDYVEVTQLGNDLAGYLDPPRARIVRSGFRDLSVSVFVIKTLVEQLRFDTERLVVEAGKPFEIIFENNDFLPHNLLFIKPGTRARIGNKALVMLPGDLDDQQRAYFPKDEGIIDGTRLLEAGQRAVLQLNAPDTKGVYEFVCTFPGHWMLMWGRIIVTDDVDGYLARFPVAQATGLTPEPAPEP